MHGRCGAVRCGSLPCLYTSLARRAKGPVGVSDRMASTSTFIMKDALVLPHLGVEYFWYTTYLRAQRVGGGRSGGGGGGGTRGGGVHGVWRELEREGGRDKGGIREGGSKPCTPRASFGVCAREVEMALTRCVARPGRVMCRPASPTPTSCSPARRNGRCSGLATACCASTTASA